MNKKTIKNLIVSVSIALTMVGILFWHSDLLRIIGQHQDIQNTGAEKFYDHVHHDQVLELIAKIVTQ